MYETFFKKTLVGATRFGPVTSSLYKKNCYRIGNNNL